MNQFLTATNDEHRGALAAVTASVPAEHRGAVGEVIQYMLNQGFSWATILAFLATNLPELIKIMSGGATVAEIIAWVASLFAVPAPVPVPAGFVRAKSTIPATSSVHQHPGNDAWFWKSDSSSPECGPFDSKVAALVARDKAIGGPLVPVSGTVVEGLLDVGPDALPDGKVLSSYSASLSVSGGTAPYAYSLCEGSLPVGLRLDKAKGTVTGTPSVAGVSSFTVRATDAGGLCGEHAYTITVS